jgi:hypothetical protein
VAYHVFYVWAYGNHPRYESFHDKIKLLEFVSKAKLEDSGYRDLYVIQGTLLEFEPCEVVKTWKVKE